MPLCIYFFDEIGKFCFHWNFWTILHKSPSEILYFAKKDHFRHTVHAVHTRRFNLTPGLLRWDHFNIWTYFGPGTSFDRQIKGFPEGL